MRSDAFPGWMSPETASGEHLLLPVNLLSEKVPPTAADHLYR